MNSPILSVDGLTISFRDRQQWRSVVRNASFDIGQQETLTIVGESGSGKSVTALSIMGLLQRQSSKIDGTIRFLDRDLLTRSEAEMRRIRGHEIAMIFQEPMTSLNPVLTIGHQIAESLRLHRGISKAEAKAETLRLLEKVRIPAARNRFDEYPHHFSGGMRQRVMIAMALACRPKLLIADEPTTALDVTIQAQILQLIKELQQEEDMSVLFITHDMGVVAEISDRTVVMYRGDVVEAGETASLFLSQSHPYTRTLLSAVPRLGSMTGIAGPTPFPIVDPDTGETHIQPPPMADAGKQRVVLRVDNLTTRFDKRSGVLGRVTGRVHAVEDVSFELRAGETLALVGESGCGKSTTGRSIMRLVEPHAGSVSVDGIEVTTLGPLGLQKHRRRIQMVFQDPFASLNPRLRIGSSIKEPLLVNRIVPPGEADERVGELLLSVGLQPEMASRFPHEFSGGQRQRICIARTLAVEPSVIIADEAVSALDVSIKAQVVNLMLDLQQRLGLSYLFISHDMSVVERISHRVAVMYLGEIVEIGSREAIFSRPQHPYTKRLLAAVPVPDPLHRNQRKISVRDGTKSPMRAPDYVAERRNYTRVSPDHLVMEWGQEWKSEDA